MWKIQVNTTLEAAEAVAEALERALGAAAVIETRPGHARARVAAYPGRRLAGWKRTQRALREAIQQIAACGLDVGRARIQRRLLRKEDWAESWKRHFRALRIGRALLIRPSWSRARPRPGQVEVVLDPGLSFGTGHHPTTEWCLRELVRLRKTGQPQAFLDIGTGSGILAIAAAKLGYAPVAAFDVDPQAVRVARANARNNGLARAVRIFQADLSALARRPPRGYELVCANLTAPLLLAERRRIAAHLKTRGALVLAGILQSEFPSVIRAYGELGLRLVRARVRGEWQSGTFLRAAGGGRPAAANV
ncbi:MAG: 50S ribosomal protein L11 methyltransferase [Verrucomicrobiae bacterium]|nr:50S ribosomal protein L11 methyltransferase [Verrucomicrobiae bacterium]